jgi:hypothetical protein
VIDKARQSFILNSTEQNKSFGEKGAMMRRARPSHAGKKTPASFVCIIELRIKNKNRERAMVTATNV